jgi:hypothetical protein
MGAPDSFRERENDAGKAVAALRMHARKSLYVVA